MALYPYSHGVEQHTQSLSHPYNFLINSGVQILTLIPHSPRLLIQRWWKHFSFGQKYSGGIIMSMLDWEMDWNGGMDYGIEKYIRFS